MGETDTTLSSNAMIEFQPYADLRRKMLQELNEEGTQAFGRASMCFFQDNAKIKSIGWTQYTPYFNDGAECVFRVHTDPDYEILINGQRWEDFEYSDNEKTDNPEIEYQHFVDIASFLQLVGDDLLKDLFGDHAEITVYPGRVDVSKYDHN